MWTNVEVKESPKCIFVPETFLSCRANYVRPPNRKFHVPFSGSRSGPDHTLNDKSGDNQGEGSASGIGFDFLNRGRH